MSSLQAIADRFEIETPRGEFTERGNDAWRIQSGWKPRTCQRGLGWRGDGGIGAIQAMYHLACTNSSSPPGAARRMDSG